MSIKERWLDRVIPPAAEQFASANEAFRRDMARPAVSAFSPDELMADRLLPLLLPKILDAIRDMAPAEARAIAGEAAESRPLDAVSLIAITDWLKEQQYDGLADEVARLPLDGGHLVIVRTRRNVPTAMFEQLREWAAKLSPGVRFLLVPHDWDVVHFQWDNRS